MKDAGLVVGHQIDGARSQQRSVRRGSHKVLDDPDGLAPLGEAQHQFDEVAAIRGASAGSENARGPDDQRVVEIGLGVEFSRQFGDGVRAQGMGGVGFHVGTAQGTVEDVVGRIMHQTRIHLAAGQREIPHRQRVGLISGLRFPFRHIDLVVSRRVEDHRGIEIRKHFLNLPRVADIDLPAFVTLDFVAPLAQLGAEFLPKLSTTAKYRCF